MAAMDCAVVACLLSPLAYAVSITRPLLCDQPPSTISVPNLPYGQLGFSSHLLLVQPPPVRDRPRLGGQLLKQKSARKLACRINLYIFRKNWDQYLVSGSTLCRGLVLLELAPPFPAAQDRGCESAPMNEPKVNKWSRGPGAAVLLARFISSVDLKADRGGIFTRGGKEMFRVVLVGGLLLTIILAGCSDGTSTAVEGGNGESGARQGSPVTLSGALQNRTSDASSDQIWPRDYKAEEFPGGTFMITDFGSPPTGDAAQVIRTLEPLAKSGSSKASYEIFLKINECLDYVRNMQSSDAQRPDLAEWRTEIAHKCKDLNPDDYASASEWLSLAAAQGSLSAQLTYAASVDAVLGDASDLLRNPEAVIQYKERSHRYLMDAMKKGSLDALTQLGDDYSNGIMLDRDFSTSYAYFLAAQKVSPKIVSNMQMQYLEKQLNPSQIVQARKKGAEIYDQCCNRDSK